MMASRTSLERHHSIICRLLLNTGEQISDHYVNIDAIYRRKRRENLADQGSSILSSFMYVAKLFCLDCYNMFSAGRNPLNLPRLIFPLDRDTMNLKCLADLFAADREKYGFRWTKSNAVVLAIVNLDE
jgi:hypothetical protein